MCCTSCVKHGSYGCYLMDTTKSVTCSSQFWSNSGKSSQHQAPKSTGVTCRGAECSGLSLLLVGNKPPKQHLSQRLYTKGNQTSTEQLQLIDSKLCVFVIYVCIKKYIYLQQEVKESNLYVQIYLWSQHFSKDYFFATYFSWSLQMFKHFNYCTYSENEFFLQCITEQLGNVFPNPQDVWTKM